MNGLTESLDFAMVHSKYPLNFMYDLHMILHNLPKHFTIDRGEKCLLHTDIKHTQVGTDTEP